MFDEDESIYQPGCEFGSEAGVALQLVTSTLSKAAIHQNDGARRVIASSQISCVHANLVRRNPVSGRNRVSGRLFLTTFACTQRVRSLDLFASGGGIVNELELVIFDLAGTTVQDQGQVPDAFAAALAEHGVEVTPEQVKAVRGASKRQAILNLIPDGPKRARVADKAYASFLKHLAKSYASKGVRAMPGAEQVFRTLRERDVRVALNTGFERKTTSLLLATLGWADGVVDAVVCGDEVKQGRPAPYLIFRAMEDTGATSVHKVANVGDTALDLKAGHNAGLRWNIGVLSGAHDRLTLAAAPHTHLLRSVADVPSALSDS